MYVNKRILLRLLILFLNPAPFSFFFLEINWLIHLSGWPQLRAWTTQSLSHNLANNYRTVQRLHSVAQSTDSRSFAFSNKLRTFQRWFPLTCICFPGRILQCKTHRSAHWTSNVHGKHDRNGGNHKFHDTLRHNRNFPFRTRDKWRNIRYNKWHIGRRATTLFFITVSFISVLTFTLASISVWWLVTNKIFCLVSSNLMMYNLVMVPNWFLIGSLSTFSFLFLSMDDRPLGGSDRFGLKGRE